MSKLFYHKDLSNAAAILGMVYYPIIIIVMLMSNHYGYSNFRLQSYNKLFISLALGYMMVFNKIDKSFQEKCVHADLNTTDEIEYKDYYPTHMAILYGLNCFFSSACGPALFLVFVLMYSK